jgi:hypothetical protein
MMCSAKSRCADFVFAARLDQKAESLASGEMDVADGDAAAALRTGIAGALSDWGPPGP